MDKADLTELRALGREFREAQIRLTDTRAIETFSKRTQQHRKMVVLFSAVGLAMAHLGLVPTQVQTLGIQFEPPEQTALLFAVALVVAYFAVMFTAMSSGEMDAWNTKTRLAMEVLADSARRLSSYHSAVNSDAPVPQGEVTPTDFDRTMVNEAFQAHANLRIREDPRARSNRVVLALDFFIPLGLACVAFVSLIVVGMRQ